MKKIILYITILFTVAFADPYDWYYHWTLDQEAPASPTGSSATGTAEAVAVNWTDPTALDLDSIRVYGGTSTSPTTWIASVAKGTQTYNWTGRTAQTLYYFRLKALDKSGNLSDYTSTVQDTALNTIYALDFDGSTEYLSKTSPVNLDLNGAERIIAQGRNSTFEDNATTWTGAGTHSCAVQSTYKYAGTYGLRAISTAVGDTSTNYNILHDSTFTPLVAGEKYTFEYYARAVGLRGSDLASGWDFTSGWTANVSTIVDADSFTTAGAGGVYKNYSLTTGVYYEIVILGTTTASAITIRNAEANSNPIGETQGTYIFKAATPYIYIRNASAGNTLITTFTLKAITQPTITAKIGSKSWTSDTLSIIPGNFEKVVYNFQATSAEVNTPIKFYLSQADTVIIDNFSITQSKDALYSYWIKTTDATAYLLDRYSSSVGARTEILTSKIKHTIGGTYTATATSTDNITSDAWTLVNVIVNRTGNMQIYFNGVANGSAVACTTVGKISNTNALNLFGTTYFAGLAGEVQVATFTDIATMVWTPSTIYYRSKAGYYFPSSYVGGTVVYSGTWEGADVATMLTDKSGTGNSMTGNNITIDDRSTISGY